MKLTKNEINEIIELRNKGDKVEDIARKFNTTKSTITYWTNEESRINKNKKSIANFRKKTLKQRQEIYKIRLPYLTNYQRRRYNEDKEFREKMKKKSNEYYKNQKEVTNGRK